MKKLLNILTDIVDRIKLFIFKTSDILFILFMIIFIIYFSCISLFK